MQIGAVAKKVGLTADAIRFYERKSLLRRPPRSQGGFRLYEESDVETLAFIRRVQSLGFTLGEIHGFLKLRGSATQACAPVCRRLQQKLGLVEAKLADLRQLRCELRLALRACNRELQTRSARCPLLRKADPKGLESTK